MLNEKQKNTIESIVESLPHAKEVLTVSTLRPIDKLTVLLPFLKEINPQLTDKVSLNDAVALIYRINEWEKEMIEKHNNK